ncbi:hypothetical protein [Gordonia sp. SL306]|uniref:hypothetical protein n=1 Tax=Gordonia sp. SL306 TaxID=2995145 RepID=UPI00226F030D|nr:hypothetical protein [Gordonia sp. SL306]WAC55549.1 hypothetical protein OVA31_23705 [Gordonia sp. SL306]
MFQQWQRWRAQKRVEPGDGRMLEPFRWWQLPGRALFHLAQTHEDVQSQRYSVDVRHWGNQSSGEVRAQLYCDGRQEAVGRLPVAFPIDGGVIEVAMSGAGIKRCHFVAEGGGERQLTPDPRSSEGRRARFGLNHPAASRLVAATSILVLLVGIGLLAQQIVVPLAEVPPIADRFGRIEPLITLPLWLNASLGVAAAIASTERALRLRYHWLLDAAGN